MKKIITWVLLCIVVAGAFSILPLSSAYAQKLDSEIEAKGLVPCGRNYGTEAETEKCTLCHLVVGIQRIFYYALSIIIAVSMLAFFIGGVMYTVSTGNQTAMESAKKFMLSSMIGLIIVACSWLIVNVAFWSVKAKRDLSVEKVNWYTFTCMEAVDVPDPPPEPPPLPPNSTCTNSGGSCVQSEGYMDPYVMNYRCPDGREKIEGLDVPCPSATLPPRFCCRP